MPRPWPGAGAGHPEPGAEAEPAQDVRAREPGSVETATGVWRQIPQRIGRPEDQESVTGLAWANPNDGRPDREADSSVTAPGLDPRADLLGIGVPRRGSGPAPWRKPGAWRDASPGRAGLRGDARA